MSDFGWAPGLMLVGLLFVVVWISSEIVDADRKELRRLRKLERARKAWERQATKIDYESRFIEAAAFFKKEK